MTTSKAQLRAQAKYDKDNTVQIESNKQGYIKALIRADIERAI